MTRSHSLHIGAVSLVLLAAICFTSRTHAQSQNFTAEPVTSMRCTTFTFDGTGSYDPDNTSIDFLWDFGDGATSTEPIIEHTYDKSGDYKAVLTVTDNTSSECSTATRTQAVRVNIPPHAVFTTVDEACVAQPINFDGSASYDDTSKDVSFNWDFGNGTTEKGKSRTSAVYQSGGDYKVALTVNDNSGTVCSANTAEKIIRVNEPPKADAGEDTILKCVSGDDDMTITFDGAATTDANSDPLQYSWHFGDGTIENGVKVSHRYAELGQYDAKLVVKDTSQLGCATSIDFITVRLSEAPKANAGDDVFACSNEEVVFDGSESYVTQKGTLSAQWFFGDGSSGNGLKATHRYRKPGKYQASLTVENQLNSMCPASKDIKTIIINSPPEVAITSIDKTCVGKVVDFDASAHDEDNDALEYYWSFGDGTILRSGPKVSHEYKQGGNYRVSVIVDDGQGTGCSTATTTTTVIVNAPPIADAGQNKTCCVDKDAQFDASGSSDPDGDMLSYTWDFGDGTSAKGKVMNHAYKSSGSYSVRLTVDDGSGTSCSSDTAGFSANVNAGPVPVMDIR